MRRKISLACVLALLFVWSLPGMTALRHVLLLAALLLLWPAAGDAWQGLRAGRWPLLALLAFLFWLIFQALFVSPETSWALGELRGQWLPAGVALAVGMLLASDARRRANAAGVTAALAGVLLLQALIVIVQSVVHWFQHGELLRQLVPLTGGRLEMSFILNILLAMLTTDLILRACRRDTLFRLPLWAVLAALAGALGAAYLAGARNGVPGVAFLSAAALALFWAERGKHIGWRKTGATALLALTLAGSFAYANYQGDPRWKVFAESATLGWDIDHNKAWLDMEKYPLPRLENGEFADHSAFARAAFIRAGLRLVGERPLGVGFGRNAFAHALRIGSADRVRVGHAHSGFIDLAVGGGIPAVLLWLAFAAGLALTGVRRYVHAHDPHGLLLVFLALGYCGRMLIDSVGRDHMLQIFMFLAGYLLLVSRPAEVDGTRGRPLPP